MGGFVNVSATILWAAAIHQTCFPWCLLGCSSRVRPPMALSLCALRSCTSLRVCPAATAKGFPSLLTAWCLTSPRLQAQHPLTGPPHHKSASNLSAMAQRTSQAETGIRCEDNNDNSSISSSRPSVQRAWDCFASLSSPRYVMGSMSEGSDLPFRLLWSVTDEQPMQTLASLFIV